MHKIVEITDSLPPAKGYSLNFVRLENGDKAVWKKYEPDKFNGKALRIARTCILTEVAAYKIDQLMGFDVIPETVFVDFHGARGSLQKWVDGPSVKEIYKYGINASIDHISATRLAVYDYLVNNHDRWGSNIIVDHQGKMWGIDNSSILCGREAWSSTMQYMIGFNLDSVLRNMICNIWNDIMKIIKVVWDLEFEGTHGSDIESGLRRLWRRSLSLYGSVSLEWEKANPYTVQFGSPDFEEEFGR